MRSSELAQMAGVTVRTLRHYHKLGLMPEPQRRENGYREYLVSDMARLMRIKNLSSLGFSLDRIKSMLDAEDATAPGDDRGAATRQALDELDAELARRIADLQRQRKIIAHLKKEGSAPDAPPEYARFLAAYAECEPNAKFVQFEKEALALSQKLLSGPSMDLLAQFQNQLMEHGLVDAYADINRRVLTLPPDADEECRQTIIADAVALFEPIIDLLDLESAAGAADEHMVALMDSYDREKHPPEQVSLIEQLEEAIVRRIEEKYRAAHAFDDESVTAPNYSESRLDPDPTS